MSGVRDLKTRAMRQHRCSCKGSCAQCSKSIVARARQDPVPDSVHQVLRTAGEPLPDTTRRALESRFLHDFTSVRIHVDDTAARSAADVSALAYTVGNHVVLSSPDALRASSQDLLLAHELAHVVQQRDADAAASELRVAPSSDSEEKEAQTAASAAARPHIGSRGRIALMRQSASEKRVQRQISYDSSNFDDRFDAEVDAANHRVALVMRLDIQDYGSPEGKDERIAKFRARAKQVIEDAWSYRYALQSVCHGSADKFEARVRVDLVSDKAHHTIHVWPDAGEGSGSTEWQESGVYDRERKTPVPVDPTKPPTKKNMRERTFHQVPVAHEFGHLMRLDHIICSGKDDRCYGITAEQKMDIMGQGSMVSKRDYEPFLRIMERYGRDALPKECNTWRLVAPG